MDIFIFDPTVFVKNRFLFFVFKKFNSLFFYFKQGLFGTFDFTPFFDSYGWLALVTIAFISFKVPNHLGIFWRGFLFLVTLVGLAFSYSSSLYIFIFIPTSFVKNWFFCFCFFKNLIFFFFILRKVYLELLILLLFWILTVGWL